jgi:hypothetical protein
MNLSRWDGILWAASFAGHVALLCVLLVRGRWRTFPVFTTLIGFDTLLTIILFRLYASGSQGWYSKIYWTTAVVDFALQVGVVLEIARLVLRPTGTWVRDARRQFIFWSVLGVALAALLAWGVSPPGLPAKAVWEVRGSLFTSLVTCELVLAMAMASTRLGLGWRSHVMALGQGLAVWSLAAVAADSIQSYVGAAEQFNTLDHVRIFVYCAALVYWIVQFWIPEPARRPISPEMRNYILALHRKVKYDLDNVDVES